MKALKMIQINEQNLNISGLAPQYHTWILKNLDGFPLDRLSEISGDYKDMIVGIKNRLIDSKYNKDGNLIFRKRSDGNHFIKTYSEDGLSSVTREGNHDFELRYDSKGRTIECIDSSIYTEKEIAMTECDDESYVREYDENGNCIYYANANKNHEKITKVLVDDGVTKDTFTTVKNKGKVTGYNKVIEIEGKVVRNNWFNENMKPTTLHNREYNKNGNCISFTHKNGGSKVTIEISKHDKKGRLVEKANLDYPDAYTKFTYDDFDNIICKEVKTQGKEEAFFQFTTFDERGNFISYKNINDDKVSAKFEYNYSDKGGFTLSADGREFLSVPDFK